MESADTLTVAQQIALAAVLAGYCRKNSALTAAMSGEAELPGGGTDAEKMRELHLNTPSLSCRVIIEGKPLKLHGTIFPVAGFWGAGKTEGFQHPVSEHAGNSPAQGDLNSSGISSVPWTRLTA